MLPRHANELLRELENVVNVGCAVVNRNLLLHWYAQQRLTVSIWRDIQEKWQEVLDQAVSVQNKDVPLLAGEGDGVITFIYGEGLTTAKGAWLKDVKDWARPSGLAFMNKSKAS